MVDFVSVKCSLEHLFIVNNVRHSDYEADICETCFDEDGCNAASKCGAITLLIAFSVALMKILSF